MASTSEAPLVFSIQHFCVHDGPGTRSIVFFKGCPLRCAWCQNPESWSRQLELAHKRHLCIECGTCIEVCPRDAIEQPGTWDPAKCDLCLRCVEACPTTALTRFGESLSVEEILERLRPEFPFYRNSGGGVTLSGGEATLFSEFAGQLARRLRAEGVHVTLETCGAFSLGAERGAPSGKVWEFLSAVDLVLYDIKIFDDASHRRNCGASNETIKNNLARLAELAARGEGPTIWPRLPLIPGMTDGDENLEAWATWLGQKGLSALSLVPYHELGAQKRDWLPDAPRAPDLGALPPDALTRATQLLAEHGIAAYESGGEPWPVAVAAASSG